MTHKNNKENFLVAGIDVSSEKLDVCLMDRDEQTKHKGFKNSKHGIQQLIEWLEKNEIEGKIVMESTGSYHELVAVTLFTKGYDVYVINPLRVKKYTTAQIRKLKTDKNDAKLIAEVALKEKKLDAFTLTPENLKTKKKIALVRSLEKKIQEFTAVMSNYQLAQEKLDNELTAPEQEIKKLIKTIDKQKEALMKEIITAVFPKDNQEAQRAKEVLTSIPGISEYYASLIYFFYSRMEGKTVNSWIAYTGLEVSIVESGKWKGAGKVTKRGNKYLRKRNYGAGWGATMNNPMFKQYYNHLREEKHRKYKEALMIIGRKILRIAFSCLKYERKFDKSVLEKVLIENGITT